LIDLLLLTSHDCFRTVKNHFLLLITVADFISIFAMNLIGKTAV